MNNTIERAKYYYMTSPKLRLLTNVVIFLISLSVGSAIAESCRKPQEHIQLPTDVPAWQNDG
jgi:hypothetical protein